jgi:hypothetical protein
MPVDVVSQFRNLVRSRTRHPRAGDVVVIGTDHYIELLWYTMAALLTFPFSVHFERDIAAARQYIAKQRANR